MYALRGVLSSAAQCSDLPEALSLSISVHRMHILDAIVHAHACKRGEPSAFSMLDAYYRGPLALLRPVTITVMHAFILQVCVYVCFVAYFALCLVHQVRR